MRKTEFRNYLDENICERGCFFAEKNNHFSYDGYACRNHDRKSDAW